MKKITWVNFLHIYQPPWQTVGVVQQIASQSYDYLIYLFKKYPKYQATVNISGCLLDVLAELRPDLIKDFQGLIKKGQLELTGTSQFHALLPLLSSEEIFRQIELHRMTLQKYFPQYQPRGFYLPEMAYDQAVAKIIKKLGYQWIILDPICADESIDNRYLYSIKNIGLQVIFRDRLISKKYPAEEIFKKIEKIDQAEVIISATDGEIYGHRHEDWQGHIEKVLAHQQVETKGISRYLTGLQEKRIISLRSASWESSAKELKNKTPFLLWSDPKNKIHKDLWNLLHFSTRLLKKYKKDPSFQWARMHLDAGSASCTFWWASAKKLSDFSPLAWHPDMIDNGAEELIRSVRSLNLASRSEKMRAERLYLAIKKNIWTTHWQKHSK